MNTLGASAMTLAIALTLFGFRSAEAQDQALGTRGPGGQADLAPKQDPALSIDKEEMKPASVPALQGWADISHFLYDKHGILIHGVLNDDFQSNVTGGLERGVVNGGGYSLGADLDLGRELHDPGGQVHLMFTQFYGKTLQHFIGNEIKSQGWYYPVEHFNLSQFAFEQYFLGDKLNFYGGRVNATSPFARPTYGCDFISGSQCPYFLPLTTGGLTSFPYVTWGARLRYAPTAKTYAQFGAYEIDPRRRTEEGFNWSLNGATGYVIPFEVGYGTDFSNDKYPRHFKFGGWYNSAPYTDPLLNAKDQSRALSGGTALKYAGGREGLYALADQVVYRPADGSKRNLAVFADTSEPFDERELFQSQSTAGFFWTGPLVARPRDTLGVMLTYIVFTGREIEYQNELLSKAGSGSFVNRDEVNVEMNYGYQIVRGLVFHPVFEYVINPDIAMRLNAKTAPKDAAILGFRLSIDLNELLGLPSAIPIPHDLSGHGPTRIGS